MKIVVTATIDVEPGSDDPQDGFGHSIEIEVTGLTKEVQKITHWNRNNVLWEVQEHIRQM